ncbi:hypothetical protein NST32_05230 [Bacillus sp. FSL L8-0215]|uniref:hypothetical protein n=1 Tax=Bacillus sp. FSL L8-0215 TaxID=2954617 RepID=UPI00315896B7
MDFKDIIKDLSEFLKIPGISLPIIFLLSALKPISFISAGIIEKKFFSKEKLFIFYVFNYFSLTVFLTVIFYLFYELIPLNPDYYRNYVFILTWFWMILGFFIVLCSMNISFLQRVKMITWLKNLIIIIYLLLTFFLFIGVYNDVFSVAGEVKSWKEFLVLVSILLFITLPLPTIIYPAAKLGDWYKQKTTYWIDDKNNKWYLIHPVDKQVILVGDHKDYNLCNKTMFLKKEDLYEKTIHIE